MFRQKKTGLLPLTRTSQINCKYKCLIFTLFLVQKDACDRVYHGLELNSFNWRRLTNHKSFCPDSECHDTDCECSRERGTKTSKRGPYPGAVSYLFVLSEHGFILSFFMLFCSWIKKVVLVPNMLLSCKVLLHYEHMYFMVCLSWTFTLARHFSEQNELCRSILRIFFLYVEVLLSN